MIEGLVGKRMDIRPLVVVIRVDGQFVIVLPGLGLAPVAFLPEGVVEVLAIHTHPVPLPSC